jgi:enterochelin esterase-like enzyme
VPRLRAQPNWPGGRVISFAHQSSALHDNPWGDPADRPVNVYLPAGYSEQAEPFVCLWDLAAFTNAGPGHLNWQSHGENLPSRLDRLIGLGSMPPTVVVMPDCFTSLGGNQYVNSPSVGNYADYIVHELVPAVSARFNVVNHRNGRGVFGKSSGGFGAIHLAMTYDECWGAVASHSGDVGFDLVYRPAFAEACTVLAEYNGNIEEFIRTFWTRNRPASREFNTLMILAMAASYDPDSENPGCIRLPFDLRTCTLDIRRWSQWLSQDPINRVERCAGALRSLHGIYFDVGRYDQYHIQFGSRILADRMAKLGIKFRYEEFDGSHSGIDWRLDYSLPFLAGVLKNASVAAR